MLECISKQYPIVIFPVLRILEDSIRIDANKVTFRAMEEGTKIIYIFNVWDELAEKVKKMKLSGRVVINSEMVNYINHKNEFANSYRVLSIRFIDGYSRNKNELPRHSTEIIKSEELISEKQDYEFNSMDIEYFRKIMEK